MLWTIIRITTQQQKDTTTRSTSIEYRKLPFILGGQTCTNRASKLRNDVEYRNVVSWLFVVVSQRDAQRAAEAAARDALRAAHLAAVEATVATTSTTTSSTTLTTITTCARCGATAAPKWYTKLRHATKRLETGYEYRLSFLCCLLFLLFFDVAISVCRSALHATRVEVLWHSAYKYEMWIRFDFV